jgi:transposase InsO family protein
MAEESYVGIDVSKAELVVAVRPSGERMTLANDRAGIKRLVGRLAELKPQLVVVEATGGLQRQVVAALWMAEIAVAAVNPSWVRNFAKGRGVMAKTDRKDAELLALFAQRERPEPRPPADAETQALQDLVMRCPTAPAVAEQVIALRRQRLLMKYIAAQLELSIATVSRLLKRAGLSRLSALDPPPPPVKRYEYAAPGDLLHLDTKKLGRFHRVGARITGTHQKRSPGAGFEVAHVCIDDHSRLAYAEVLPNERKETTTAFLARALDHFQALGVSVARIMTDNGSAYRAALIADLCRSRRMRHLFTRPYTPRTNGKAERFIQTAMREWAYARSYDHSQQRADALPAWLHSYNHHRSHRGIGDRTPISRLPPDNLLQPDT